MTTVSMQSIAAGFAALSFLVLPALAQEGGVRQFQSPPAAEFGDAPPDLPPGAAPDLAPGTADPALDAAEFDALTRGKTFDTYDSVSGLYGVESFLSGQRVIWRDAERCMNGSWEQVGEQICFLYEDKPNEPVCWTYHDRSGWILGRYQGFVELPPIMLYPAQGPISCQAYLGA
ncbi:hypothetical protein [Pseudogemmobacter bohemicus]|uniref:hypothetical protein n=1 Tax=Pseudogemmobacter bohemicus TaxID=2250708 RepID=UPI000DD3DF25|nr:hypothetical protein [Pseudogemmobacter bohemicus]